jgi:hypothetical protein
LRDIYLYPATMLAPVGWTDSESAGNFQDAEILTIDELEKWVPESGIPSVKTKVEDLMLLKLLLTQLTCHHRVVQAPDDKIQGGEHQQLG